MASVTKREAYVTIKRLRTMEICWICAPVPQLEENG